MRIEAIKYVFHNLKAVPFHYSIRLFPHSQPATLDTICALSQPIPMISITKGSVSPM